MANLSIFQGLLQPPKSVADYDQQAATTQGMQLQNAGRGIQNQTAQLTNQKTQTDLDRSNQLLALSKGLPQGSSDLDRLSALRNAGFYDQADALSTSLDNRSKSTAAAAKDTASAAETTNKTKNAMKEEFLKVIPMFNTPDDVKAYLAQGVIDKKLSMDQANQMVAQVPIDPAQLPAWQMKAMRMLLTPEQQTKLTTPDANAVLGAQTQTTNNAASNAAHLQATGMSNAVQMRGQDMVNARTRESTAATMTKPFEVTGPDGQPILVQQDRQGNLSPVQGFGPKVGSSKPLNDSQAKALGFGSRMQEADKALAALEAKGTTQPSIAKRIVGDTPYLGAAANMMSTPDEQSVEQVQRDFVNAVLRRESGAAISESEFANARKQYFPQQGDSKEVRAVKAKNRLLSTQGVMAEVPVGQRTSLSQPAGAPSASPAAATGGFKIISVK